MEKATRVKEKGSGRKRGRRGIRRERAEEEEGIRGERSGGRREKGKGGRRSGG